MRRLPSQRNFLVTAGLKQVVDYLTGLHFEEDEIEYLRSLRQFANVPAEFFAFLRELRFTGDLFAMPEGTPAFAGEPILIVRAPLVEAQLVETYLLSSIAYQTTIASKAARCVLAAKERSIVEFGSRRGIRPKRVRWPAGGLPGRLYRHQQYGSGDALWSPGLRNSRAFLGHVVSGRGSVISRAAEPAW